MIKPSFKLMEVVNLKSFRVLVALWLKTRGLSYEDWAYDDSFCG